MNLSKRSNQCLQVERNEDRIGAQVQDVHQSATGQMETWVLRVHWVCAVPVDAEKLPESICFERAKESDVRAGHVVSTNSGTAQLAAVAPVVQQLHQ